MLLIPHQLNVCFKNMSYNKHKFNIEVVDDYDNA